MIHENNHRHKFKQAREMLKTTASDEQDQALERRLRRYLGSMKSEGELESFEVFYGSARDLAGLFGYWRLDGRPALYVYTFGASDIVLEGIDNILEGAEHA
jgi:hypothetical protein